MSHRVTKSDLQEMRRKAQLRQEVALREGVAIGWVREDGSVVPEAPKLSREVLDARKEAREV
jgi:hypothetical protein